MLVLLVPGVGMGAGPSVVEEERPQVQFPVTGWRKKPLEVVDLDQWLDPLECLLVAPDPVRARLVEEVEVREVQGGIIVRVAT